MNVRKQETRLEHAESASNGIDSAFTTMVQRWLVKGSNGKWQLPVSTSKRQANGKKLPSASRKRQLEQSKRPTKKLKSDTIKDTPVEAVSALHIHHKLAMDFLERSKTCSRAGVKSKTLETSGSHPSSSRQRQRAAADVPCSTTCKDERPRSSGTDVKEEHARVECASSIQAKTCKRTRVLVLNRKVSPLSRGSNDTNAGSDERSAPPLKYERGFKKSRSQPASGILDSGDSPKAKAKAEVAVESGQVARTKHSPADGIPMLCNGQRKCKKEGCYKAAYQRGLCPAHGGRNKCRAEGCKNYAYAQGLCQAHGAGKPHAVGNSTAERAAGEIKTGAVKQPPKLVQVADHNDSSDGRSSASSAKTTSRNTALKTEESTSSSTTESQLTPAAADAWHSSDLPKLFRSASCKRTAASAKSEKGDYAALEEKPSISQPPIRVTSSQANATVCKVRGCKQSVASEGFCQTHVKRKRCREEGCTNLAVKGSGGLCSCHARRKACAEDGCTKKARLRGRCSEHGGKYFCREEGCGKTAYLRGLCGMHLRESQDPAA
ncbi:hypothetical protein PHYPSEUDO_002872 [Phytophthora pseudosyringae]|uniref:WRKY transcription factor 19 n=1 Tax=Phytophthora pseudosyringae TaxID=221518 RepID=A0A8T1VX95_9STRA|nr:hypothetical protein PHYPSEUDO_002872 [Phytophthora pseudosyringae]